MSLVGFKANNHPQQTSTRGARDDVDDRGTRWEDFNGFTERFGPFDLDVAAAPHNAKCDRYYTREDNGLEQEWNGRIWCNPPYSDLGAWVRKAWDESNAGRAELIVMLVPANRTEQKWWQNNVEPYRGRVMQAPDATLDVRFLPGRMRFDRPNATIGPKGDRPPFGCALLIWKANK